jgi:hypothetical protein
MLRFQIQSDQTPVDGRGKEDVCPGKSQKAVGCWFALSACQADDLKMQQLPASPVISLGP